jgi:hypothetical protein
MPKLKIVFYSKIPRQAYKQTSKYITNGWGDRSDLRHLYRDLPVNRQRAKSHPKISRKQEQGKANRRKYTNHQVEDGRMINVKARDKDST